MSAVILLCLVGLTFAAPVVEVQPEYQQQPQYESSSLGGQQSGLTSNVALNQPISPVSSNFDGHDTTQQLNNQNLGTISNTGGQLEGQQRITNADATTLVHSERSGTQNVPVVAVPSNQETVTRVGTPYQHQVVGQTVQSPVGSGYSTVPLVNTLPVVQYSSVQPGVPFVGSGPVVPLNSGVPFYSSGPYGPFGPTVPFYSTSLVSPNGVPFLSVGPPYGAYGVPFNSYVPSVGAQTYTSASTPLVPVAGQSVSTSSTYDGNARQPVVTNNQNGATLTTTYVGTPLTTASVSANRGTGVYVQQIPVQSSRAVGQPSVAYKSSVSRFY